MRAEKRRRSPTALLRTSRGAIGAIVAIRAAGASAFGLGELQVLIACAHQAALGMESAERRAALAAENERLRATIDARHRLAGESEAMERVRRAIAEAATSDAAVLILGESGTGKELAAEAIHAESARGRGPFVAVNCGAIPAALLEAELFGHERGAFTGADSARAGYIERAGGGTLFLDEVGELPGSAQVALLRVLEQKRVRRIGGIDEVAVDFRVLAATHRDLEQMVSSGAFRADLYYRIRVLEIAIPPLRDRPEDIANLAARFLESRAGPARRLSVGAIERLRAHRWPGNARELRNVLERAALRSSAETIGAEELGELTAITRSPPPLARTLREVEAEHVKRVLDSVDWNKARAAEILGIGRPTVYEKIRMHRLRR
jgi:transcriptional regulator with PAS, ATPase and Fis domain